MASDDKLDMPLGRSMRRLGRNVSGTFSSQVWNSMQRLIQVGVVGCDCSLESVHCAIWDLLYSARKLTTLCMSHIRLFAARSS